MEFRASTTEDVLPIWVRAGHRTTTRDIFSTWIGAERSGAAATDGAFRPGSAIETGAISTNKAARQMATLYLISHGLAHVHVHPIIFSGNAHVLAHITHARPSHPSY